MAITNKEQGVWNLDEAYNKQMAGYWSYDGVPAYFGMGSNSYGTLGLNNRTTAPTPQQIPGTMWNSIGGCANAGFATILA